LTFGFRKIKKREFDDAVFALENLSRLDDIR